MPQVAEIASSRPKGAAGRVLRRPNASQGLLRYVTANLAAQDRKAGTTLFGYVLAWVAWVTILWGIDLSAVVPTYPAKATLATVVWACIVWITDAVPAGISGLLIPLLLFMTHAVPRLPQAFGGFVLDVSFLCLGAFMFGAILWAANLDTRIALTLLSKMKSARVGRIILALFGTNLVLAVAVPAAVARAATLLPVVRGITQLFGEEGAESNAKKAIVISALSYAPVFAGVMVVTAHMPNVIMVGLFDKELHVHISWTQWFLLHLPIIGLFPISYWMLRLVFHFHKFEVPGGVEKIQAAKKELGPTKRHEIVILVVFAFVAVMWALEDVHKISTGMMTLIGLGVFFIPGVLPLKWKAIENKTIWGTWLLLAGALSMAGAMGSTGLGKDLAALILPFVQGKSWMAVLFIIMFATQFIRLGMLSNVAAIAMLAPIMIEMARMLHMNPVAFTLLVCNVNSFAFLLPTQVATSVIAYGTGTFSNWDFAKAGFPVLIAVILYSVFVMAPWYALNGFPVWAP